MLNWEELSRLASKLNGLPVLGCRPDSPAALAGVRYGDILLTVNGLPTPDWSSFLDARATCAGEMVIELFRAGAVITVRLTLPERSEPIDAAALLIELATSRVVPLLPRRERAEPEPS